MKILQIIYESLNSPFGFGGAGIRAYEIYKRLKERHDITLLCMKYPNAKDKEIEGLRHIFLGTESKNLSKTVLAYTYQTSRFVKQYGNEFDIVIENFLPSMPFFSKYMTKTPVILQVQGILERHSLRKFSPIHALPMFVVEGFYPSLYRDFIFVSDVTKQKVLSRHRVKVNMSKVIANGIHKEYLDTVPIEKDYILFFSRLDTYTKGLDLLIKAFQIVNKTFPELRLVLAGYEFNKFSEIISELPDSLKKQVKYVGFVTGQEKLQLLSEAIFCILPSRHESFPVSIIEAFACQKPLVVSNIPELEFVKREGLGLDFELESVEDLAWSIISLLTDEQKRKSMGKIARDYAKRFLWDEIALEFENALNEVACRKTK
ncbi:MAG: glycosyltransferase family 4 protein [Thermodesulfovibrionales bacterium]|nr:glycosyltransferase family 4 protein [Thermodesulfovibrionales bacterium]